MMGQGGHVFCDWAHGSFVTHRLGGMTAPVAFKFDDGVPFSPLAVPPWEDEALPHAIPGHIRGLRGVFPCLPFGVSTIPPDAAPRWRNCDDSTANPMHGAGANGTWRIDHVAVGEARIDFAHADDDVIAWSAQRIRPIANRAAISFYYRAMPRSNVRLPFGYHVMLDWADGIELDPGPFVLGLTYPGTLHPGQMLSLPNSSFSSLEAVPGTPPGINMRRPDWLGPSEDVVMLRGVQGKFSVSYQSLRRRLDISWDPAIMPNCLVWYSRFGLTEEPWRGRYSAIGIEPVAAAFDFLPTVSAAPNPLNATGVTTSVDLTKDVEFTARLELEAFAT